MGNMNETTLYEELLKMTDGDKLHISLKADVFNGIFETRPYIRVTSIAGDISQSTLKNMIDLSTKYGGNLSVPGYGAIKITFKEGI